MHLNTTLFILVLLLLSLLSACSRIDDNSSMTSEEAKISNTLEIASHTPLANAENIPIDSTISISFQQSVDATTVVKESVIVSDQSEIIQGNLHYDSPSHTILFTPATPLKHGRQYTVSLKSIISSTGATLLSNTTSWSFTTLSSQNIPVNGTSSAEFKNPMIAFAENGNGLAVWETGTQRDKVLYALYDATSDTWSEEKILSPLTKFSHIDMAHRGNHIMIVWSNQTVNSLLLNTDTKLFSHVQPINPPLHSIQQDVNSGLSFTPKIAANETGFAVVWQQKDSIIIDSTATPLLNIYASFYTLDPATSGQWNAPTLLTPGHQNTFEPDLVSNDKDYAVTWRQKNEINSNIYAIIYEQTTQQWGDIQRIESLEGNSDSPQLASDGRGFAITWQEKNGTHRSIYINRFDDPGTGSFQWLGEERLGDNALATRGPRISSSGKGYAVLWGHMTVKVKLFEQTNNNQGEWQAVHEFAAGSHDENAIISSNGTGYGVAWLAHHNGVAHIFASRYQMTSTDVWQWQELQVENNPASASSHHFTNNTDQYAVIWTQNNSQNNNDVFVSHSNNEAWQPTSRLISQIHLGSSSKPLISQNDLGDQLAAWEQYHNGKLSIWARLYRNGAWEALQEITSTLSSHSKNVQIAHNGQNFMIVWEEENRLFTRLLDINVGWKAAIPIDEDNNMVKEKPLIASSKNDFSVIWMQRDNSLSHKLYASIYQQNTWSTPAIIGEKQRFASHSFTKNQTGYAASWYQFDNNQYDLYVNRYVFSTTNGDSWQGPELIQSDSGNIRHAKLIGSENSFLISWFDSPAQLKAKIFPDGEKPTWSSIMTIADNVKSSSDFSIAANNTRFIIGWFQNDLDSTDLLMSQYVFTTSDSNWQPPETIITSDSPINTLKITRSENDFGILWRQEQTNTFNLFGVNQTSNGWAEPIIMEDMNSPVLDMSFSGGNSQYVVVWIQANESDAMNDKVPQIYMKQFP